MLGNNSFSFFRLLTLIFLTVFSLSAFSSSFFDRNIKFKMGARLHLDGALFNDDKTTLENDWIVRRARLSFKVDLFSDWRLAAQYDLLNSEEPYSYVIKDLKILILLLDNLVTHLAWKKISVRIVFLLWSDLCLKR